MALKNDNNLSAGKSFPAAMSSKLPPREKIISLDGDSAAKSSESYSGKTSNESDLSGIRKRILGSENINVDNKLSGNIARNGGSNENNLISKPAKESFSEINAKKGNRSMKSTVAIASILLLLIVGLAAAFLLVKNSGNKQKESPQDILKSSMKIMDNVKTCAFKGSAKYNISGEFAGTSENPQNFSFDMKFSGKTDEKVAGGEKGSYNMSISAKGPEDMGSVYFNLDAIAFGGKASYFRLNDYDLGFMDAMYGSMLSSYKGKWYAFDEKELENFYGAKPDAKNGVYAEKLKSIFDKYEIFKFRNDLGDVKLGGIDTYHYQLNVDGKNLIALYLDILKEQGLIYGSSDGSRDSKKAYDLSLEQIKKDIEKYDYIMNDVLNNIKSEVWIGKNDRYIYRIKVDGMFDEKFVKMMEEKMVAKGDLLKSESNGSENKQKMSVSFAFDTDMSDFNKAINIEEPKDAQDMTKVFEGIMQGFMGGRVQPTIGEELDSDNDGLPDDFEEFYGANPHNPDTDGDGFKDGDEVKNGYDPTVPGNAKLDMNKILEKMNATKK